MKTNSHSTTSAFVNIFPDPEKEKAMRQKFPPEQNEEIILNHLRFAEKLFPKKGLALCPVSHGKAQYYSLNCEQILGRSHEELMKLSLPEFFELIHPEDLPSLKQCFLCIKSLMPFDPEMHRFEIQYRLKNRHNEYMHIRNEQVAIKMQSSSYLYLMLYSNNTHKEKFFHVKLDIYQKIKGDYRKIDTFNPRQQEREITPRQNDIVQLIIKGFTNQEIAERLGVSVFTVKNHKKTLFRKVNVKNSVELANYVLEASA